MKISQKMNNRIIVSSKIHTPWHISKGVEKRILKRYLHAYVHCSIIHKNQEIEVTLTFINRWMDEENTINKYSGKSFKIIKGGIPVIRYNMDKSWGHYAK